MDIWTSLQAGLADWIHFLTPYLTSATAFESSQVPGLLSGMGVINTVAVFAYANALNRVAGVKYRRRAAAAFVAAWAAIALVVLAYVWHSYFGGETAVLVDIGLVLWILSFPSVLLLIFLAARDSVGRGGTRAERDPGFRDRFAQADFGVDVIDGTIRRALQSGCRVTYPFLLIHDIGSPGLRVAARFAQAGLRGNEAVVYLTFSRPYSTVLRRISRDLGDPNLLDRLWIVDCYSRVYMPDAVTRWNRRVRFADPRDPSSVYFQYMATLRACRRVRDSVRSVYEPLSDFIKIADADLVMHFLRRVVVLEETRHIRALYLFWSGVISGAIDQNYLRWFFSTTLEMTAKGLMTYDSGVVVAFERLFPDPVVLEAGAEFRYDEASLFAVCKPRVEAMAPLIAVLAYAPAAYGFLPAFSGTGRGRQLANFLFFMVAIDHDTHRPAARYEAEVGGVFHHGSDLLYALAESAKTADPELFLPDRFAAIGDDEVARIFTAPNGAVPADVAGRTRIFRAAARRLIEKYDGDALALVGRAGQRLGGADGLLALLRGFEAYADPLAKKANLLVKTLMREGLLQPVDPEAIDSAIDHVLMTMALRSGMVRCHDRTVAAALAAGQPLNGYQISVLREVTGAALRALSTASHVSLDRIDDLVWSYGREAMRRPTPLDSVAAVRSELDARVNAAALPGFLAFLNGIDADADPEWRCVRRVTGPFTRHY